MMLNRTTQLAGLGSIMPTSNELPAGLDVSSLLEIVRRQWIVITIIALLVMAGGTAYLLAARPVYLANAYLLLDTRRMQPIQQQTPLIQDSPFDAPAVESQMEVLRSETLALAVVEDLGLSNDPEFVGGEPSFFDSTASSILRRFGRDPGSWLVGKAVNTPAERTRAAIAYLRNNLRVQRVRTTYVLEVGFTSYDPGKAVRVANAVAEGYILDQTQAKQYTARRATNWLQERMNELREQAVAADRAVEDFRIKNNLVKLGGNSLNDQQLADLNAQLARAREQTSEVKARRARIKEIMNSRVPDASMTAWLQNDVINGLRQQYVSVTRREAEYTLRLGAEHQAVINARKEMRQIERAANEELRRILSTAEAEYEAAQAREREVQAKLQQESSQFAGSRQEQGVLQILESVSKTYQTLHDTFLQRYIEATTQQDFTTTEARVITAAAGGRKVYPNPQQTLTFAALIGLMLGCGAAYGRERLDRAFRTPKQVEQVLGIECLGILPAVEAKRVTRAPVYATSADDRSIREDLGIARQVMLTPFSRFTETVRSIKVAVDTNTTDIKVIGFVSALPGEGKSTLAANTAQLAAHGGSRALLIDVDLRQPSLSGTLAPDATTGLLQVLGGISNLAAAIWHDPMTGLDFLPVVMESPIAHTSEILASRNMVELIATARESYDYVILDFPPLAPVVDAKAASHLVDGFVLVVEWGITSPQAVTEVLAGAEVVQSKLIGVALNRANPTALKRIEYYKGHQYQRYYTNQS